MRQGDDTRDIRDATMVAATIFAFAAHGRFHKKSSMPAVQ